VGKAGEVNLEALGVLGIQEVDETVAECNHAFEVHGKIDEVIAAREALSVYEVEQPFTSHGVG